MSQMNAPIVSILICTRNRADSLRQTIISIGRCEIPADLSTELLVVDNGSSDNTRRVVERAELKTMPVRYIHEPRAGQCFARNRGLAEANGEVFIFTDDDTRLPGAWIEGMARPILNGDADAVAGGVILPEEVLRLLSSRSLDMYRSWFAATDQINVENPERMVGANMAFSRRVLELVPGFDTSLGPGALGFYDETLFSRQLLEAGCRIASRFDISVEHHFDTSRLSRAGFLSSAAKMGESEGYYEWHWQHISDVPTKGGLLRAELSSLARRLLRLKGPWSKSVAHWELEHIVRIARIRKMLGESSKPRKYERNFPRRLPGNRERDSEISLPV
ncbi:MAG: glycosyltransferase [Planctomycetota bacterium]|nr:glycosyltransferase [Planctomycetota bacterium]